LSFKKVTIVLLSDGTNKVRQFRLPKFFLVFFILAVVSCAIFLSLIIRDYQIIKTKTPTLVQLQKENEQQKEQLLSLTGRMDQMNQKMEKFLELDLKLKAMVHLETSDDNTYFQGVGGSEPNSFQPDSYMAITRRELVPPIHSSLDNFNDEIPIDGQDKAELHNFLENQKMFLFSTPSIWPTKGWLSSRFGYRASPFTGAREFHKGIDISTRMNSPVVAPAEGIILSTHRNQWSGNVLSVNHGYGLVTRYAHLQRALVKKGQYVKRGERIALVGKTGRFSGPLLHYEVYLNGVPVNPLRYVRYASKDAFNFFVDRPTKKPANTTLPPGSHQVTIYEALKPNGTFYTAQEITEGIIIGSRGTSKDRADYYKVRATGNTMALRLEPVLKERNSSFMMTVFDEKQRAIGEDLRETARTITLAVTPQASYYIKLDFNHAPIETLKYQLQVDFKWGESNRQTNPPFSF
jgi:murein DD-endopeptidase MepM/ murein hydrolase activator NlpD